jgi:hypothetical protein
MTSGRTRASGCMRTILHLSVCCYAPHASSYFIFFGNTPPAVAPHGSSCCCCAPRFLLLPAQLNAREREGAQRMYLNARESTARVPQCERPQLHARERDRIACVQMQEREYSARAPTREREGGSIARMHMCWASCMLYHGGPTWWCRDVWCSACLPASQSAWGASPVATSWNKVKQLNIRLQHMCITTVTYATFR